MGDRMRPMSFSMLMNRVLDEYKTTGSIFGIKTFYKANPTKTLEIFGEKLETPFGPAAGPHTQLSENIITAYLCGARFFELKTVQTLDGEDLPVSKPCILAADEGYNVEWSTELRVEEALTEYINAWYALKLISVEFGLGAPDGFIFNMSVGYDLAGISSQKIDGFINGLKDASATEAFTAAKDWTLKNISRFEKIDPDYVDNISSRVCGSITLSTLHGCPPDEIERIARYLITEKRLNTFIKCNPTLLGYEYARKTVDELGFDYLQFGDGHFRDDLQFEDAVPMLNRLQELADEMGVSFGVKLSNTFPVDIAAGELPGEEMYMSGRALFPLTVSLAKKLSKEFDGKLRISYSGGADIEVIDALFDMGIWPITLATDILKPGGYMRLNKMAELLASQEYKAFESVDEEKLAILKNSALKGNHFRKSVKPVMRAKIDGKAPITDCFTALCHNTCPINQDIPAYLNLLKEGKKLEALKVITERNPLPHITGTICPHPCESGCMRSFYEGAVDIRGQKLDACAAYDELISEIKPAAPNGRSLAVVGGGPAGMAAAFFAAREGVKVTVFERTDKLGGIVRHVIPDFRIADEMIDKDAHFLEAMGVDIKFNTEITSRDELEGYEYALLAIGSQKKGKLDINGCKTVNVIDFLTDYKAGKVSSLGSSVVIIGGGNTAMDAARAAKRVDGVKDVRIVYRRNKRFMPADEEELMLAIEEGVEFVELSSPVSYAEGKLKCEYMALGEPDESGRRSPVGTGKYYDIAADTVIAAVGEKPDVEFIKSFDNAVAIGDANGGPATVVEAIRDAAHAISVLFGTDFNKYESANACGNTEAAEEKKGSICKAACMPKECERCLGCADVCETCVDVCPNRANVSITVDGKRQILHLDYLCNECGNCAVFCPYSGRPYKDKLTLFSSMEDFENSKNPGFYINGDDIEFRVDPQEYGQDIKTVDTLVKMIKAVQEKYPYLIKR
ncbi:MAG: putative selenate reductase subunit YgfK [Christensenellaceae bacterium]|nr:putative selenate reductase subunit YgfK [Christensenellaceae bacterium]